ncbi:MAG: radical SAM/Cys-rich domain protein [Gammaproteobacteria bacterium]|nr:MAG: radical SAM/Cys-rich domain protein [Gammaproteobacteria bacterium]
MLDTAPLLERISFPELHRDGTRTLQVNLGYRCNQACRHCHVDAGPKRTEEMDGATVALVLEYLARSGAQTLDLTGGAPELNPHFRHLVVEARRLGVEVIDRCNLTILEEPDQEGLAEFLAANRVRVTASLPCYQDRNVDAQRGEGVFERSIRALRRLNGLGYGDPAGGLVLELVYNPLGPTLPPPQKALEAAYRRELEQRYGVRFNRLLCLANMPIRRFGHALLRDGTFHPYLELLRGAHRDENLEGVMCRTLISVDWQGWVHDCDFNQMLGIPLGGEGPVHLRDLLGRDPAGKRIATRGHCYGCTAGQGSSCGGALEGGG